MQEDILKLFKNSFADLNNMGMFDKEAKQAAMQIAYLIQVYKEKKEG